MEKSTFQFTEPNLIRMDFSFNKEWENEQNKNIQIKQDITYAIERADNQNTAVVSLTVELGEEGPNCPIYLKAIEQANFRWESALSAVQVDNLLNQNAPSLLLSYLRPIVSQITSVAPIGTINIPFVNFTNKN